MGASVASTTPFWRLVKISGPGMGVGVAPRRLMVSMYRSDSGTRILMPSRSEGVLMGRGAVIMDRKPNSPKA